MPATRSRTENWQQSLREIHARGGALEVTLPHLPMGDGPDTGDGGAKNLIWRVRILGLSDDEILVEEPMALGRVIPFQPGSILVGIIAVGQNRWMFQTVNLGRVTVAGQSPRPAGALRLRMPETVERCQRRNFYRISTVGLNLPGVECHTLLNLGSVAEAESANRARVLACFQQAEEPSHRERILQPEVLPEVGPPVGGLLMNIGGGGVGLIFEAGVGSALDHAKPIFMKIDLRPTIPHPVVAAGRIRHTHIDSAQRLYAGVSFEFAHGVAHQQFIVDQLCRYASCQQQSVQASKAA